jgi:L-lysine 2,3-aminomutase
MIPLTDVSLQVLSTNQALDQALDSDIDSEPASWQRIVNESIRDISALLNALALPDQSHYSNFPILVPTPYLARIERGNLNDPLLKQVMTYPVTSRSLYRNLLSQKQPVLFKNITVACYSL